MKIGILTYHRADNYGAILQAYALQKTISMMGHECKLVDYRCKGIEDQYRCLKLRFNKSMFKVVKYNINQLIHKKKHIQFEQFRNSHLVISNPYTLGTIKDANKEYDLFIVGSDQVWNMECNRGDHTYFLDFVNDSKKKNSYAASFGKSKIPDNMIDVYHNLLSGYNFMSVREQSGQMLVKKIIRRECELVLDPVFLLSKEQWSEMIRPIQEKYILLYQVYNSASLFGFAKKLSEEKKCRIISISQGLKAAFFHAKGTTRKSNVGPVEFLSLIRNAEYVVTNSFHGTAFSIIFNKLFFTEPVIGKYDVNSRFENLFNMFDIYNRSIVNEENDYTDESIDYQTINKLLNDKRTQSFCYLRRVCEGNQQ